MVYPAVIALGYDPIWFGIIVVKMCEVCLITPPIGLNCFVVNAVRPDIPLGDVFRGIGPFFVADVIDPRLVYRVPGDHPLAAAVRGYGRRLTRSLSP